MISKDHEFDETRTRQLDLVERQRRETVVYDNALKRPRGTASQVYSLRLPVERVAQLREVAEDQGVTPSALIRSWVVAKLDQMNQMNIVEAVKPDPMAKLHKFGLAALLQSPKVPARSPRRKRPMTRSKSQRMAITAAKSEFYRSIVERDFANINARQNKRERVNFGDER
jgi:predicted DNA-binding protein